MSAPGDDTDPMEDLTSDLARWAGEDRAEQAAASRSRQRWLTYQAAQDRSLASVALGLAEHRTRVVVVGRTGRSHTGEILAVGRDFWAIGERGASGATLVPSSQVGYVRPHPERSTNSGNRPVRPLDLSLAQLLDRAGSEGRRVSVVAAPGDRALAGRIRYVGSDVVAVEVDGVATAVVYVPLEALREVSLLGSG